MGERHLRKWARRFIEQGTGGTPTLASALASSSGDVSVSVGDIHVPGSDASGIDAPALQ